MSGWLRLACACLVASVSESWAAEPASAPPRLGIAAASNLIHVLEPLHREFRRTEPLVELRTSVAASGSLFAQISPGAPFDVFLSADTDYPARLGAAGLAPADTQRTFARGRLALWTLRPDLDPRDPAGVLRRDDVRAIALAQPRTAPYGQAAEAVLAYLGLAAATRSRLVISENIAQAAQWVETGTADAGFVAVSVLLGGPAAARGRWHELPAEWHAPITLDHALVLTRQGAPRPLARRYAEFLLSPAAQKILQRSGYGPAPR
jgi:molybdate transport system substrate-binding protein